MVTAIPKGETILVTGVNGFIGSHIADQFLEAGYKIRGTTRDLKKVTALKELWTKKYGADKIDFVTVPEMGDKGAFDEAIKGVSGVAHVASDLSMGHDPTKIIPPVINGVENILKAAAATPTVKRFVYTSSSTAATAAIPNRKLAITTSTWNEDDIKAAHAPPPYGEDRKWAVYGSSKTEAEKAVWNFVKEKKPAFVANAVLPNANFGTILVKGMPASTGGWITGVYNNDLSIAKGIPPQWFVDVQDTARAHVAAMLNPAVENERIFAFTEPFTWNLVLKTLREIRPDHKLPEDFTDPNTKDLTTVENQRFEELVKWMGRPGLTYLRESLERNVADL